MQIEQGARAFARGGRLTKWKGQVASVAPSLFLCSVSVLATSAGSSFGEVVNGPQTTPLVSTVVEDHTITAAGSIDINRLLGPALVQINVPDYSSTLTNAGRLSAPEANLRTRAAIDINGDLSGTVLNSGTISMGASLGDSAVMYGIDVSGIVSGAVQNTGVIEIANSALTLATSVGILANQVDGTLSNTGTISLLGSNSSRAEANGLAVATVNGTLRNSGGIVIDVSSSGGQALSDGISVTTINGTVENSGPVTVSVAGAIGASADGIGIGDLSGDLNNTGTINVAANGGTRAAGDAIEISNVSGHLQNSGSLTVSMTAASTGSAYFDVIEILNLTGTLTNSGSIDGQALGGSVFVDGVDISDLQTNGQFDNSGIVNLWAFATSSTVNADGLDFGIFDGTVSNTGQVNVIAGGITSATARGVRGGNISGVFDNNARLFADARASNGSATAYGIQVGEVRNQLTNDGPLVVAGTGTQNGAAIGISADLVQGTLTNNGEITATGQGSSSRALGVETRSVDGTLINTNALMLSAIASSFSALATGIETGRLNGQLQNSGSIAVHADAVNHASAYGIDVGEVNGSLTNSGSISVHAINGTSVEAIGIRSSTVTGTFANSGNISVAAKGSYVSAEGIRTSSVADGAALNNTGTISVIADSQGSQAIANGVSTGLVAGTLNNSGNLTVQAKSDVSTASVYGLNLSNVDGQLINSGSIMATAQGETAEATGIRSGSINGTFRNTGSIAVMAQGGSGFARGIEFDAVDGTFVNTGTITVAASGGTTAGAFGIISNNFFPLNGDFSNSGNITVAATAANGSSVSALGMSARVVGATGRYTNSGNISVAVKGDRMNYAYANGIQVSRIDGQTSNSGDITVTVENSQGSSAFASGFFAGSVLSAARMSNSGSVQVTVNSKNVATAAAIGLGFGNIDGNVSNSGAIIASAQGDTLVRAHGLTSAALSANGVLNHSGLIAASAYGSADAEAYGLYLQSAQGLVNITGDISAQSSGKSYAVYLGDGGGTLNVETTANIDGLLRVSDHDVNLANVGGRVIYRFQDDDTSNGVFSTSTSSPSLGWYVENEGGSAPVYASFNGQELQPNTNQSFEIANLSYDLVRQLDDIGGNDINVDEALLSTHGDATVDELRPYFLISGSRSEGTTGSTSKALSSTMWSASAGLIHDLGTGLRYGFGASYLENNGTFDSTSFDTSGAYLSAIAAQDFGIADLSLGLGYGLLNHSESRTSGTVNSNADYSSNMITALVAAQRDFALPNGATFTPRASFLYGEQYLDSYTETGSSANATVGERDISFSETRIGAAYSTAVAGGSFSASLAAVHRDAHVPSFVDVAIFGNTLALASGGGETDTFGEAGLSFEKEFDHGGNLLLEARSNLGADVSTQALWASYQWRF
ncbi:beta strand repeat-containing protein [Roseibium sp. SCP14]|uniref:beta strand repeat-containing protein n=1 Tax=Roseibium sp. SCP14 TaxID=3141375 RepID=UPI00333B4B41